MVATDRRHKNPTLGPSRRPFADGHGLSRCCWPAPCIGHSDLLPMGNIDRMTLEMAREMARPASAAGGLREVVRQFTPNWFTVTIGTAVLPLALNQFPISIPRLITA